MGDSFSRLLPLLLEELRVRLLSLAKEDSSSAHFQGCSRVTVARSRSVFNARGAEGEEEEAELELRLVELALLPFVSAVAGLAVVYFFVYRSLILSSLHNPKMSNSKMHSKTTHNVEPTPALEREAGVGRAEWVGDGSEAAAGCHGASPLAASVSASGRPPRHLSLRPEPVRACTTR